MRGEANFTMHFVKYNKGKNMNPSWAAANLTFSLETGVEANGRSTFLPDVGNDNKSSSFIFLEVFNLEEVDKYNQDDQKSLFITCSLKTTVMEKSNFFLEFFDIHMYSPSVEVCTAVWSVLSKFWRC